MAGRIRVELVGIFPTIFSTMCKVACNPTGVAGVSTSKLQLSEYPREVVEDMEKASAIFAELSKFPDVEVRAVQASTFRGLWLSLRHRLKNGLFAIIDGKVVLDARTAASDVRKVVQQRRVEGRAYDNLKLIQPAPAC